MENKHVLINGAGIGGTAGTVDQIDIPGWDQTIAVNLNGTFYCTRLAVPRIKKAGMGSIINFSSTAGFLAYALRSPYAAAKWGIIGFTKTLALELGKDGIRANAICPGIVEGERMDRVIEKAAKVRGISVQEVRENYTRGNALKTFISPEEIASTILFLCSEQVAKITGQSIAVDGFVDTHDTWKSDMDRDIVVQANKKVKERLSIAKNPLISREEDAHLTNFMENNL